MAQPQAYNRETDFTERDGDDTNHAGINTELDAAALSINELRDNLALIQADDGALKNGIVTAESLSDSAFNAVLGEVATATAAASASADRSTLFATQAEADRIAAQAAAAAAQSSQTAAATSATAAANSQTAAANSATSASTSASTATTKASEASTSASSAATSATSAATSSSTATTKASEAATSATNAANSATTATTQAGIATTQATNAAASAAAAAASFDDFDDRYLGPKSAAPTTDNDGNPLQTGALYFDTNAQGEMRVWNGTIWKATGSAVNGTTNRATYTATAGQTTFAIAYDVGFVDVYLNGLKLQSVAEFTATNGTSIVLTSGATAGDIVDIVSYGVFSVADIDAADVSFSPSGAGAPATTVQNKLRDILASGQFPLRPAFLEQHFTGFFGRGMLTAETINTPTEQAFPSAHAAGTATISVTNATHFLVGGCVTIKHANGRYGTYFVDSKSGNNIGLRPSLRYAVSTSSRIERTWFNSAHPGKFYMRELAQRVAHSTELEAAMPDGGRILFTNVSSDPNTLEDRLVAISGAAVYYYAASNLGETGTTASPVRFGLGRSAYVENLTVGAGVETQLFKVPNDCNAVAKITFMARDATPTFLVQVLDGTGKAYNEVLSSYTIPVGANQQVMQVYTVPFNTRSAQNLKVRVTCTASPSAYFIIDQIDVFEAPATNGKIVSKAGAKIVCLGDSWMAGDLGNTPEREPIPTQLAFELPDATVINAGVGGNKIWDELARFDADVAVHSPDYVVINTGTNECYSPASGIFDPNSIDYFVYLYRLLINKILSIGARPIIIGVPALAQTDADVPGFAEWLLNDRAKGYAKGFFDWQATRPLAYGGKSGYNVFRRDATLTSGATPSVAGLHRIDLTYGSATTITNLLNGVDGQIVQLVATNENVTLGHGTLLLDGAANVTLTANSTITLMRLDPAVTGAWVEISRSLVKSSDPVEITLNSGTTPSVTGARYVNLEYASATTITNLTGGVTNQEIQIRAVNGNVTLTHSNFQLTGSTNVTLTTNSIITLRRGNTSQTGAWFEVSRSIK